MDSPNIEIIELNDTDISPHSERLAAECGEITLLHQWWWLMLRDDLSKPPLFYARYVGQKAHVQHQGLIRFSDNVDQPHEFHMRASELVGQGGFDWERVDGDPERYSNDEKTYEYRIAADPGFLYRGSSAAMRVIENDVLDLTLRYFPYALKVTDMSHHSMPYNVVFGTVDGTLDGRPIQGMGGNEVVWMASRTEPRPLQLIFTDYCAVRTDGRRECAYVMLYGHTDAFAFFWLEGEEPILTTDVRYRGEFVKSPYANDGVMIPVNLDYRFAGRELHYRGEWGFRQWGDPVEDALGVANSAGHCYMGGEPCDLDREFATSEVHQVFANNIRPSDY